MANISIRKAQYSLLPSAIEDICNQLIEEGIDKNFIDIVKNMHDYVVLHHLVAFKKEQWAIAKIEDCTAEKFGGWYYEHPAELIGDNGIDLGLCYMFFGFNNMTVEC